MTSSSPIIDTSSNMIADIADVDATPISFASTREWEDMVVVSQQDAAGDLLSDSSHHSEAAQVFQTWKSEEDEVDIYGIDMMDSEMDGPGIVSDDDRSSDEADSDNEDIIMQLEDDEGLLPTNLDDFYDSLAKEILLSSSSNIGNGSSDMDMLLMLQECDEPTMMSPSASPSTSAMPPPPALVYSHSGSDSFFANASFHQTAMNDERARFDAAVRKLAESMRKSQASRQSLYARSTGLANYKRLGSVQKVLQSIEFTSRHVDSYCRRVACSSPTSVHQI